MEKKLAALALVLVLLWVINKAAGGGWALWFWVLAL